MEGHRIPYKIQITNTEWFKEGCIRPIPPEKKNSITFEELERDNNERNKF